jgi:hypothetical protein
MRLLLVNVEEQEESSDDITQQEKATTAKLRVPRLHVIAVE